MSDELKPCPFCGGIDGYVERMTICTYQYICDCGAQGQPVEKGEYEDHEGDPEGDAINAWNTRAPDTTDAREALETWLKSHYIVSKGDDKAEPWNEAIDCLIEHTEGLRTPDGTLLRPLQEPNGELL